MNELPSFLQQTAPNAFTLTLSASAAETFMLCPAKYSWSRITGIEAAVARAGMNYGKALHLALAHLYSARHSDTERMVGDAEAQMRDWFERNPQPALGSKGRPEWRTLARALQAFAAYRERYPAEDFEVLGVEEPFEVELGKFDVAQYEGAYPNGGGVLVDVHETVTRVTVKFRGIRDLRVRWHDAIWVLDHKTSTEWSDLTADEGKASFQFMGYGWVERFLQEQAIDARTRGTTSIQDAVATMSEPTNVGGVLGNYLIARAPFAEGRKPSANALPRDQFERVPYPFSDEQLDEWHERAMRLAQAIWRAWSTQEWDQHSTACAHWGRCEYYQLCWETEPAYRLSAALGADYRPRTPSPFEDEKG